MIPYIALILTIAGVIIGASIISLNKFGSTMDNNGCSSSDYFLYDGTTTVGSEDNATVVTANEFFSLTNGNIANGSLIIMNASDVVVGNEKILVVHTDYETDRDVFLACLPLKRWINKIQNVGK